MKHLPKHLRPRWRYLAVELETWPGTDLAQRSFQREVWYAGQNLLGDPGSAAADLQVIRFDFDAETGRGSALVRVRRGETESARAAIACLDSIDGDPVGLWICGSSGTIRAAVESHLPELEQ